MKLNFAMLAKQINTNQQNQQSNTISNQLNYYRKSTVQQKHNSSISHRKSQLNEQNSQILLGSSILSSYFNHKPQQSQILQREHRINLSVMYPYEISKSLSPLNIDKQINEMKSKGILNQSAVKFVKKQVLKGLQKSKSKIQPNVNKLQSSVNKIQARTNKLESRINKSVLKINQSIFLQTSIQNNEDQTLNLDGSQDIFNFTQQSLAFNSNQSIIQTPINLKLFKNFLKNNDAQIQTQNKSLISVNRLNVTQIFTPSTKKKPAPAKIKQQLKPRYMDPIRKFQTKKQKQIIPTQTLKQQAQLKQVKSKPSLEFTKASPFTQKVTAQRESKYINKKQTVFDALYNEAYVRQCVQMLQKQVKQKQIDQKINMNKISVGTKSKKYKVDGTFLQRLQKSIEKKYYKDYLRKKYEVNQKTGQQFFKPYTKLSAHTYESLFHRSLQKLKTQPNESVILATTLKKKLAKNGKSIKQSQTYLSNTYKSVRQTKQNSMEKLSQIDKLNRSMQFIPHKKQLSDSRSSAIVENKNQQVLNRIIGLFYPQSQLDKTSKKDKQFSDQQIGFQKSYQALSHLSQQQYHILSPLFQQVQTLQKQSKVTVLMFRSLLSQFYKRLNYYDQLVLRQRVDKLKRKQKYLKGKNQKSIDMKSDSICDDESIKKSIKQQQKHSFCPKINEISACMQKINPKYQAELYYV